MNKKNRISTSRRLKLAISGLHDELKSLVLTCSPEFPVHVLGGMQDLKSAAAVINALAIFCQQILLRLANTPMEVGQSGDRSLPFAIKFLDLYNKREKLDAAEPRSEDDIDEAVRRSLRRLEDEIYLICDEGLREVPVDPAEIPEVLYYATTVLSDLGWYFERYLIRLTGDAPVRESR